MKKDYIQLLQERKFDPNKPPAEEQICLVIESKNIGSLQNFITITGAQKSGKTKFTSAIAAAAISHSEILGIRVRLPEGKQRVAWFDTEQSDFDFSRTMQTIRRFADLEALPAHFDAYNVREDDPHDIANMIASYLQNNEDVGLLIVDGILDLLHGFNDEKESKKLINFFKRYTKKHNILAVFIIHKGKTTASTLGHLGAMADRAAQSVLAVEKNKERQTFILKADYLRSAEEFTPIEIYFNKGTHNWEQTIYNPEQDTKVKRIQLQPHEVSNDIHLQNMARIFNLAEIIQYKSLVQHIKEIYAVGETWSKKAVPYLVKEGILFKNEVGYTMRQQARLFIQN